MSKLRFVHAADLHLDSPFSGLRAVAPDEVSSALRSATFDVYDNIVDLCIEERVDALLVAGDVYDGADRSLRAQLKFVDGLRRWTRPAYVRSSATATTTHWTAGRPGWTCRTVVCASGRR